VCQILLYQLTSSLSLVAHFHGQAISLSFKTKSDISQKSYNQFENPISTGWGFEVLGRILRFDYLQFCISTANLYQSISQSIAESNYQASLFIGRNPSLNFFLFHCTTLDDASFSWMFDSKLQGPKYVSSNMPPNG